MTASVAFFVIRVAPAFLLTAVIRVCSARTRYRDVCMDAIVWFLDGVASEQYMHEDARPVSRRL